MNRNEGRPLHRWKVRVFRHDLRHWRLRQLGRVCWIGRQESLSEGRLPPKLGDDSGVIAVTLPRKEMT